MIITKQKRMEELLNVLEGPVFITGCSECAAICHTGGEEEVLEMKKALEKRGVEVSGWVELDPACHLQNDKRLLRPHKEEIEKASSVLALCCGNGSQTLSEILDVRVVTGTDTLFLGEIKHAREFVERCMMCGECIVDEFGGLCPVTRCPKHMLNGPCGGSQDGKCEVNPERDCVWHLIYEQWDKMGRAEKLEEIQPPQDWSKTVGNWDKWRI